MSRRPAAALLTVAIVGAIVGVVSPAQAHESLVSSTPEAGSTITEVPEVFSVTGAESFLDLAGDGSGFALQVVDSAGYYYGDGCLIVSDATMTMGATLGLSGDYALIWQVVSDDGHPVSGEIAFSYAPAAGTTPTRGATTPPACGEETVTPTTTPGAEPQQTGSPSATPVPISAPESRPNADLRDVLWIGGAIAAVLGAGILTFLYLGRQARKKAK